MIEMRIEMHPSAEVLALGQTIARELRDIRLLLGRVAWNVSVQAERTDATPGAPLPPGAAVAAAGEPETGKWTAARLVLLGELVAQGLQRKAILARINALPGAPIASVGALSQKISTLALPRPRAPAPTQQVSPAVPSPPVEAEPAGDAQAMDVSSPHSRPADEQPPGASFAADTAEDAPARRPATAADLEPMWTPERLAEARRLVAARAPWPDVQAAVNALPGRKVVSVDSMMSRLRQLGITRPPRVADDGRVVIRSTARPAVLLTGAARTVPARAAPAPFRAVDPALVERDGAPSATRLQLRRDAAASALVPIVLGDALTWRARNGCARSPGETPLAWFRRVNARRGEFGLPAFALTRQRGPLDALPASRIGGTDDGADEVAA